MARQLSIIMYHYVRDKEHAQFPDIKGLTISEFAGQVGYLKQHYQILSADDFFQILDSTKNLPSRAALLTFDDGYVDHFRNVLPVLLKEGLKGCFFIPAHPLLEQQVLDVNKIHFILAAVKNKEGLVTRINQRITGSSSIWHLDSVESYWSRLAIASRFDPPEVIYIKRILQRELPAGLRKEIITELFKEFVTKDERDFARSLYMDQSMLQALQEEGMYLGSHGYDHVWLNQLSEREQVSEVEGSLNFLRSLEIDTKHWMMCYPHGGWNDSLLKVISDHGCQAALTTRIDVADLDRDNPLTLPRLDTNDLPMKADAAASEWTRKVG
jgi:peptidoglycan/xylan/chitin deacetylase (PgdA/CDA1 family)